MKLLLDTHAFLWLLGNPSRLSLRALELCEDSNDPLILSVVSVWEIQIKQDLGKLELEIPLDEAIRQQQAENGLRMLPVELHHVMSLRDLPRHHGDPFDRLLIAQDRTEGLQLVTPDSQIEKYDVLICW